MDKLEQVRYYQGLKQAIKSEHGKFIADFIVNRVKILEDSLQQFALSSALIDEEEQKKINRIKLERITLNTLLFDLNEGIIDDRISILKEKETSDEY
jgi:Zn-dependent oligopeptidase